MKNKSHLPIIVPRPAGTFREGQGCCTVNLSSPPALSPLGCNYIKRENVSPPPPACVSLLFSCPQRLRHRLVGIHLHGRTLHHCDWPIGLSIIHLHLSSRQNLRSGLDQRCMFMIVCKAILIHYQWLPRVCCVINEQCVEVDRRRLAV